ncbi:ubiquitin carboxyl-terminal hydrolase MINDY-1/2 [Diplonema papillatum]|nr:ubiquitin carboxyl-terminal hydrolase MINDY-1/2 [Diplonema papillatum]
MGDATCGTYQVKRIRHKDETVGVLLQNENGPCPLLAIANIMFLRRRLTLHPDVAAVTDETLLAMLAGCLKERLHATGLADDPNAEYSMKETLETLPALQKGMDVNIKYGGIADYEITSNIAVFDSFNVRLVHGWLPSEADPYYDTVKDKSYNQLVDMIIKKNDEGEKPADERSEEVVRAGLLAEAFVSETAPQLTYTGLFRLAEELAEGEMCVLFRNNHFSTLTKQSKRLYALLTDVGYSDVRNAAWESLSDVDGNMVLVDGNFEVPADLGRQARVLNASKPEPVQQQQPAAGGSSSSTAPGQAPEVSEEADRRLAEELAARDLLESQQRAARQEQNQVQKLRQQLPPQAAEDADAALARQIDQEQRARQLRAVQQQQQQQPPQHGGHRSSSQPSQVAAVEGSSSCAGAPETEEQARHRKILERQEQQQVQILQHQMLPRRPEDADAEIALRLQQEEQQQVLAAARRSPVDGRPRGSSHPPQVLAGTGSSASAADGMGRPETEEEAKYRKRVARKEQQEVEIMKHQMLPRRPAETDAEIARRLHDQQQQQLQDAQRRKQEAQKASQGQGKKSCVVS